MPLLRGEGEYIDIFLACAHIHETMQRYRRQMSGHRHGVVVSI